MSTATGTGSQSGRAEPARSGQLVRPLWQRWRFWLGLGAVVLIGAFVTAILSPAPGRDLDPSSASKGGSKALAVLLRHYGVTVIRTDSASSPPGGDAGLVIVAPDDYSSDQLQKLVDGSARTVLLDPSAQARSAIAPAITVGTDVSGTVDPDCSEPGAVAAGPVDLPAGTVGFSDASADARSCYQGAYVVDGNLAVLGSPNLLRNDRLADRGVAALDINAITADFAVTRVVWLMPGTDADGPGAPSISQLFPAGASRAVVWLLVVGLLVVVWRARRLGPPVEEPLPVVVRAAEVVEGHGRLYRRAGARDRASAALRAGSTSRLAVSVGLPPGTGLTAAGVTEVVAAVSASTGRDPAAIERLLKGPVPADDGQLLDEARQLQELEAAARRSPGTRGTT